MKPDTELEIQRVHIVLAIAALLLAVASAVGGASIALGIDKGKYSHMIEVNTQRTQTTSARIDGVQQNISSTLSAIRGELNILLRIVETNNNNQKKMLRDIAVLQALINRTTKDVGH